MWTLLGRAEFSPCSFYESTIFIRSNQIGAHAFLTFTIAGGIPSISQMTLGPQSIVAASKDQLASAIGGETVILGLSAGRYYGVDSVGARIWQLIQEPTRVAEVQRTIVSEYAVDPERCEADLLKLLQQMIDAGLVEVRSASAP